MYQIHGRPLELSRTELHDLSELSGGMGADAYLIKHLEDTKALPASLSRKIHILDALGQGTPQEIETALGALHRAGVYDAWGLLDPDLAPLWTMIMDMRYDTDHRVDERIGRDLETFATTHLGGFGEQGDPAARLWGASEDPEFQALLDIRVSAIHGDLKHAHALLDRGIAQGAKSLHKARLHLPRWFSWIRARRCS